MFTLYSVANAQKGIVLEVSVEESIKSKAKTKIITFASIGIIFLFCVFLFPLLNKIFDRYKFVIRKFALLSEDVVK